MRWLFGEGLLGMDEGFDGGGVEEGGLVKVGERVGGRGVLGVLGRSVEEWEEGSALMAGKGTNGLASYGGE